MTPGLASPDGRRGLFVVFEGPEGAGKSTQIATLEAHLRDLGRAVVTTREPGGTAVGQALRALVLTPGNRVEPLTEFLLYAADRAQHVAEVITPALAGGRDVISDRFTGASLAYQGYGRGIDLGFVRAVNAQAAAGAEPDVTFLLDIDPAAGLDRVERRSRTGGGERDRLEGEELAFHQRVREGYLRLAGELPGWQVIDAGDGEDVVSAAVLGAVARLLAARPPAGG